jgi:hypothetical protein
MKKIKITNSDLEFYKKIKVPVPQKSPEERQRRIQSFEKVRNLYHRNCDATNY